MAATRDRRFLWGALGLALVALALMTGDKVANPDIANRATFDALQLTFSVVALVTGVAVMVSMRRKRADDGEVVDLRERLAHLVDVDDLEVDREMAAPTAEH